MVGPVMFTKSRSLLVSLAGALLLAVGALGCDVEDSSSETDDAQIEDVDAYDGSLSVESDRTLVDRQIGKGRVDRMSTKLSPKADFAAPESRTDLKTTEPPTSLDALVFENTDGNTTNPASFGMTKTEPVPDPWNPIEPDPWAPNDPKGRDDRH